MYPSRTNKPTAGYITSLRPLALLTLLAICGGGSRDAGAATRILAVASDGTQQDVTPLATVSATGAGVSGSRRHHHPPPWFRSTLRRRTPSLRWALPWH